ncbi:MAG: diaminopimelate epimerase [Nitrospirota bacterium]|nr:MAG: diaminopimelate epimerase [Nitrospirota bacterium]
MMKLEFLKMHGTGNDFILFDGVEDKQLGSMDNGAFSQLAKNVCHRRFGIGADQVLVLLPSDSADFMMRILNADGSEVEMCGNGIRCLARYIWDREYSDKDELDIETKAGIIRPKKNADMVRVDMGKPVLNGPAIPVKLEGKIVDHPLKIDDRQFMITCVSMGNPHAVIVVDNVDDFPVSYYGPLIETHDLFPNRTNVEFIAIASRSEIKMRVWERGSGETMACGTGAAAVSVASSIKGLTDRDVTVHLPGGDLFLNWADNDHVYMTGPAVSVFKGTIEF